MQYGFGFSPVQVLNWTGPSLLQWIVRIYLETLVGNNWLSGFARIWYFNCSNGRFRFRYFRPIKSKFDNDTPWVSLYTCCPLFGRIIEKVFVFKPKAAQYFRILPLPFLWNVSTILFVFQRKITTFREKVNFLCSVSIFKMMVAMVVILAVAATGWVVMIFLNLIGVTLIEILVPSTTLVVLGW